MSIRVSISPAYKEGLPVAEIMCRSEARGQLGFDDSGLKMTGFFKDGIWPFRSGITALASVCTPEGKEHDGQPETSMRFCHLPNQARGSVVKAIKELALVCPMKEKCQTKGCWDALKE